ncbi:MAG: nucleotide exchange factor GrpE [Erysipelotrichaceae bacterium]|nr:nucleotide exchange factor GrpE [Erysipelotrichaceae bacterium]
MRMKKEKQVKEELEVENTKIQELEEQIAKLSEEVASWKNKYYEAYADMDNLRKKMEKDHQVMFKYRGQGFLEALLPVFDNFYYCFKFKPEDPTLLAYCKGFEMIYNQMVQALEAEGVKEIVPELNKKFDPSLMQAVDVEDGEVDDLVVKVMNKGYMLKDRLIRPAMVVVSKIPQKEEKSEEEALEVQTEKAN